MKRIKIDVQYKGTNYSGWQIQPNKQTIQGELQEAIFKALNEKVEVVGSGRTDAGVHALKQVAHFDTETKFKPDKLWAIINKFLPEDIKVLASCEVSSDFHARFNSKRKTYIYNFYTSLVDLPLLKETFARIRTDFNFELAKKACSAFLGEHDFAAFCSSKTNVESTVRTIYNLELKACGSNSYCLSVCGNGFLYSMVRIIAGTIIDVGLGFINPNDVPDIIKSKNRSKAGKTASACGLCLKEVEYNDL